MTITITFGKKDASDKKPTSGRKPTKKRMIKAGALVVAMVMGLFVLSACEEDSAAQDEGQALTEEAFANQSANVPYPADQLTDSLERRNLKERLLRYNQPSKISYIYLLSFDGKVISYMTIKGKVSSNQSQMTTDELVIDRYEGDVVVSAPGDDGSYGMNEPGIFFFTTDNVLVTWSGDYLLSDAPMNINTDSMTVEYPEGSTPSSVGE